LRLIWSDQIGLTQIIEKYKPSYSLLLLGLNLYILGAAQVQISMHVNSAHANPPIYIYIYEKLLKSQKISLDNSFTSNTQRKKNSKLILIKFYLSDLAVLSIENKILVELKYKNLINNFAFQN